MEWKDIGNGYRRLHFNWRTRFEFINANYTFEENSGKPKS